MQSNPCADCNIFGFSNLKPPPLKFTWIEINNIPPVNLVKNYSPSPDWQVAKRISWTSRPGVLITINGTNNL